MDPPYLLAKITFRYCENDTESILQLDNIDINHIGYYYCVEKIAMSQTIENALKNNQASRIYLYVNDSDSKFNYHNRSKMIRGLLYDNITIPCKPISKSEKNVNLMKCDDVSVLLFFVLWLCMWLCGSHADSHNFVYVYVIEKSISLYPYQSTWH